MGLARGTYRKIGFIFPVFLFFLTTAWSQAQPAPSEYKVKAVFLYNFTQFTEWPESAFPADNSPFVIGILGENPFGTFLKETVAGEYKLGHPIVVRQYRELADIKGCHILFVHPGFGVPFSEVLAAMNRKGILTVGDSPGFTRQGGMIRFYALNSKIRFEINPEAAKAAGLTISSKLLRLADIYVQ